MAESIAARDRDRLWALTREMSESKNEIENIKSNFVNAETVRRETIKRLHERVDMILNKVNALRDDVAKHTGAIKEELTKQIDDIKQDIIGMRNLDDVITERLTALENGIEAANLMIQTAQTERDKTNSTLKKLMTARQILIILTVCSIVIGAIVGVIGGEHIPKLLALVGL